MVKLFILTVLFIFTSCNQSVKIFCMYIQRNSVWTEIRSSQWYERSRIGNRIRTYLQQKIWFMKSFCSYIYIAHFFSKTGRSQWNKTESEQLCFVQHLRFFILLCIFEQIKLLLSTFQKWGLYLEELSHWTIPKNFINRKLSRRPAERPDKIPQRWKICLLYQGRCSTLIKWIAVRCLLRLTIPNTTLMLGGEMADFDPLFLNTRHTFCSKSFLLQGSEKNMIPSLPSDPNHKILLIANGRFLTNRHTLLTEKQTCQLQSRRSPCRTTKPILSLSTTRSFMLPPLTGNIVLVQKYWMSILNKKIHLLFVKPTGGEKTLLYQTISAQLKGVFT